MAGPNPWDAPTLEWSVSSPPPSHDFDVIPSVHSRYPLWESRLQGETLSDVERGMVLDHGKEMLATTALESEPDVVLKAPEDSLARFVLTLGMAVFFVGLLTHLWWLALVGLGALFLSLLLWLWPEKALGDRAEPAHG